MLLSANGEVNTLAGDRIELSLTESFAKHKRNVLLICSVIVILAVAGPDKVKIPFSGTDEGVPAAVAYFLLMSALVYFFSTYWIELMAVQARNLEATAGEGGGLGERLTAALDKVAFEAEQMRGFFPGLKEMNKRYSETIASTNLYSIVESSKSSALELEQKLKSIREVVLKDDFLSISVSHMDVIISSMNELNANISNTAQTMVQLKSDNGNQIDTIQSQHKVVLRQIKSIGKDVRDLTGKLEKVSSRISRSQRIGFSTLERAIPVGLSLIALVICADGVMCGSYYTQKLRDRVPAIAEAQRLDAQTGTHIDGKP